jgi:small subunit ribosomal protein S6
LAQVSDRPNRRKRIMPFYEHVFIARQDLSQAQVDALAETVTNIVTEFKGEVHKTETWGLKQLAYKIQKNRKGHYVMLSAEVSGEAIAEIERQAAISEDIIRWMTIKVDELEKGPSVMMRKQERRGGRGGRDRDGEE